MRPRTPRAPRGLGLAARCGALALLAACAPGPEALPDLLGRDDQAAAADLAAAPDLLAPGADLRPLPDPFADRVLSFQPGPDAGFGQDRFPQVVLGPPDGGGPGMGGLDVLSLGTGGVIVLELSDLGIVDGPGPDLLVFENPFRGNEETAFVAASEDGVTFREWPCAPEDRAGRFPGCAGVGPVLTSRGNGVPATDPARAGGDAFDLAAIGLPRARFLRLRDSGQNRAGAPTGGFDLDGIAVVHGEPLP